MANFNTHLFIASAASIGAALVAVDVHLIAKASYIPWFVFLGTLGGLLPDIDANNSRPVKLLFSVLALTGTAAALYVCKDNYAPYLLLLIAIGTYLFIRHAVFALFNRFTVHRGVFHSILAALFFSLLITCISYHSLHWDVLQAWLNGIFIALGFIVHLLLDELYSTDLSNLRMKNSFGTAFKLFNYESATASVLMTVCTIMLCSIAPSPTPLVKVWKQTQWHDYLEQISFIKKF